MELTARTTEGAALVALAERLAADMADRSAAHDRDGSFPDASIDALRDAEPAELRRDRRHEVAGAGAFMHPLGANRAYSFLARTALGMRPEVA
jgi:hypothetical protein